MTWKKQLTMFDVKPYKELDINLYHDESGTYVPGAGDQWLLHGIMLVSEGKQKQVFEALQKVRHQTNYHQEVHYVNLRGHLKGPKTLCAKGWLNLYAMQLSGFCFYHCLAIDTHASSFDHSRFSKPHYAYNRFARMPIEGAIAWSLKGYHRINIKFYSDEKFRREGDNFGIYIPKETCASIAGKRKKKPSSYPEIRLKYPEVIPVMSDPLKTPPDYKQECEMIQLVDLMTSNIAQAITNRSIQKAKIVLAEMVASWIEDTRRPPWLQTKELHRRFSISFFPDEKGQFYNKFLAIKNRNQLDLFKN